VSHGELVSACKQFDKGKLDPASAKYQLLVTLAGGVDEIPAFCAGVLGT